MELLLKKGQEGLNQDFLIYGREYTVSRDGEFVANAIFIDDPIHGEGFFIEHESGALEVCVVDEWEFAN